MSVINNLVAQPNRVIFASEFVNGFGEKGASLADLEKMLSPLPPQQSPADDGPDGDERSGSTISMGVLTELLRLKIIERVGDDYVRISAPLASDRRNGDWAGRLQDYLFPLLTTADLARDHGQGDLPDALCWLLQQSPTQPLGFSAGKHYNILVSQIADGDTLCSSIAVDAKYQNVIYWARFLGLVERVSIKQAAEMVIGDPTRAIAPRLSTIFGTNRQLTPQTFRQRLAAQIPVLDGGAVWQDMQGRLREPMQAKDKHFGGAISLALLRLQRAGKIQLEGLSDATSWMLEVGRETKSISHITYLENAQ
ncbi:MAG TPA: protein DpdG [Pseudoduganella sp.]|jgi:hypothetical protein